MCVVGTGPFCLILTSHLLILGSLHKGTGLGKNCGSAQIHIADLSPPPSGRLQYLGGVALAWRALPCCLPSQGQGLTPIGMPCCLHSREPRDVLLSAHMPRVLAQVSRWHVRCVLSTQTFTFFPPTHRQGCAADAAFGRFGVVQVLWDTPKTCQLFDPLWLHI